VIAGVAYKLGIRNNYRPVSINGYTLTGAMIDALAAYSALHHVSTFSFGHSLNTTQPSSKRSSEREYACAPVPGFPVVVSLWRCAESELGEARHLFMLAEDPLALAHPTPCQKVPCIHRRAKVVELHSVCSVLAHTDGSMPGPECGNLQPRRPVAERGSVSPGTSSGITSGDPIARHTSSARARFAASPSLTFEAFSKPLALPRAA
jgi:hypothetical protein